MARIVPRARRTARAPRGRANFQAAVDADAGDAGWIDVAAGELRLRRDDGRLLWSQSLPDFHAGLARLEFGGTELESLAEDEADEGGFAHEHG